MRLFRRRLKSKCLVCNMQDWHDTGMHRVRAKHLARSIREGQKAHNELEPFFAGVPAAEDLHLEHLVNQKTALDIEAEILHLDPDEVKALIQTS